VNVEEKNDMLEDIFERQTRFMEELRANDRLPEWPIDLTTKPGQRLIKETIFNAIEELAEASYTLKNRMHRLTDDRALDLDHYKEELGDTLAYFIEICVLSGIDAKELFNEYKRKNQIVLDRIRNGY
jgi:NTP pyrophosphatase (non-canonical NTP hydrolase)